MTQTLVITHFYNEEMFLPFWIDHHMRLFDKGVLIDYASTDRSRMIAETMLPEGWEIRDSRNSQFYAEGCDAEVMEIEEAHDGWWKMALNVTEFLLMPSLNEYIDKLQEQFPHVYAFRGHGMSMVDPPALSGIRYDAPLVAQKTWGIDAKFRERDRIIHKQPNGNYATGRHQTYMEKIMPPGNEIYLLWYGYSPYPEVKSRVLQIQDRMPQEDKDRGLGLEHIVTSDELDGRYREHLKFTKNLLDDPDFEKAWRESLENLYG